MHKEAPEVCVPCERDDQNVDMKAIAQRERKLKNAIGSIIYSVFVMAYTMTLFLAICCPQVLPFFLFSNFEVLPNTYDQMLTMWASFDALDPVYYGFYYLAMTGFGSWYMKNRNRLRLVKCQRT